MKSIIYFFSIALILSSCKNDSNPIITDPPNPYAQKEIDWPSLQKAPWPMYRHDPQLTGRSQYVGPAKGIIADTINTNRFIKFAGGITIDNGNNAYVLIENDTLENLWSYNLNSKSINWKSNLFVGDDNPNMPTVLSNGFLVASSYDLTILSNNGILQLKKRFPIIVGYNSPIDKAGNIYFVHSQTKILYCISQSGQTLWTFSDHRFNEAGYQISFSPDGNTLYLPCARENSLLALDIATREVKWTFGSLPLHTPPMVDNQGNIYF